MNDVVDQIRCCQRKIGELPPVVHVIIARHDVPSGGNFRYWDTRGRLIVYVSRDEIAALLNLPVGRRAVPGGALSPPFGIPVIFE